MSLDEEILLAFVLPLAAIALGSLARSTITRRILQIGGGYFLITFGVSWVLSIDCGFNDFHFGTCRRLPQGLANAYGTPNLVNIILFSSVGPVLVIVAGVFEGLARRSG